MQLMASHGDAQLYRVARKDLPSHTYLISNPDSRAIHFNPSLVAEDLYPYSERCSAAFLSFVRKLGLLKGARRSQVAELVLLSGGLFYFINRAFQKVFCFALPRAFLGVRRVMGKKPRGIISYDNFESVPEESITIIGDTIATGATLVDSIRFYCAKVPRVKKIIIFTIAGALPGLQRLAQLEKELTEKYGTQLFVFYSDGIFGLAHNRTDMMYFHPESMLTPEGARAAQRRLGYTLGERMCVVWDWGQRNKNPMGHLEEVIMRRKKFGTAAAGIVQRAAQRLKELKKYI